MVKAALKRLLRILLGAVIVLLGVVQLFTPGQGLLFILVGLMIMAKDIPPLQRLGRRIAARFPRQAATVKRGEAWLMEKLRKMFRRPPRAAGESPANATRVESPKKSETL